MLGRIALRLLLLICSPSLLIGQNVETIVLPMTPCPMGEVPAEFLKIDERREGRECALSHRKAMNESWDILVLRNGDEELDRMLTDRPDIGETEISSWYSYMAKRFQPQVRMVIEASKRERPAKVEPEWDRQGQPILEVYAANGALFLAPALFDWILDRIDKSEGKSVVADLPWVMKVIEDWNSGTDSYRGFDSSIENGLMAIAIADKVPNLGVALRAQPNPYRNAGGLYSLYRNDFVFFGRANAEDLVSIQDLGIPDEEVIEKCKELSDLVFEHWGVYDHFPAESAEAFRQKLEMQCDINRETLEREGESLENYPDASPLRLAIMASIVRYERLSVVVRELYRLPVHRSIDQWKKVRQGASPTRAALPTEMCELSRAFVLRPLVLEESWRTAQAIRSASLIFFIRDHLAKHGEFPESLSVLNAEEAAIDPVTDREFQYERIGRTEAHLDIASFDQGIRRRWKLILR